MDITIQDQTEDRVSADVFLKVSEVGSSVRNQQMDASIRETEQQSVQPVRTFRPQRFAIGLLSTTSGVALILGIGFRAVEMRDVGGDFTPPLIGILVLIGVILLGGGFGVMATSSSGFDEEEFDRLASAGNISAVEHSERRGLMLLRSRVPGFSVVSCMTTASCGVAVEILLHRRCIQNLYKQRRCSGGRACLSHDGVLSRISQRLPLC